MEIRGIEVDYPDGNKRVRVVLRDTGGDTYDTVEIDPDTPQKIAEILAEVHKEKRYQDAKITVAKHVMRGKKT